MHLTINSCLTKDVVTLDFCKVPSICQKKKQLQRPLIAFNFALKGAQGATRYAACRGALLVMLCSMLVEIRMEFFYLKKIKALLKQIGSNLAYFLLELTSFFLI